MILIYIHQEIRKAFFAKTHDARWTKKNNPVPVEGLATGADRMELKTLEESILSEKKGCWYVFVKILFLGFLSAASVIRTSYITWLAILVGILEGMLLVYLIYYLWDRVQKLRMNIELHARLIEKGTS